MRQMVLAMLIVGVYSHADAEVLCRKANGAVFVRSECKPKETQIDPVALGLQGPKGDKGDKGDTGSQGPAGPGATSLAVYDTNGNKVGDTASITANGAVVPFKVGENLFGLEVIEEGGFKNHLLILIFFESTDCSGASFSSIPNADGLFPPVLINAPGRTVYLPDRNATPQVLQYHSRLNNGVCQQVSDITNNVVPATPLINLDTLFTLPFHVEVQE